MTSELNDTPPEIGPPTTSFASVRSRQAKAMQFAHSPLGFCVLALLIVEVFVLGAGRLFELTDQWKVVALGIGVGLFLLVFIVVIWLVVKHPQNLVFSEESHVQYAAMQIFGTESKRMTAVEAINQALPQLPPVPPTKQIPREGV